MTKRKMEYLATHKEIGLKEKWKWTIKLSIMLARGSDDPIRTLKILWSY
ncbi:MAG: hypothetical protein LBL60_03385 [Mycoplasmataceae bacterium]|jgi:hypothetical protein|nr:hypothetical protein [Mycoplasmataceae bacterium]